jgi:hypothetical protein
MDLDDLLKSIREEGPSKGGSIAPAKFFGEDRYKNYLEEITSSGTLDGENLTAQERKEAFKKRNDKIGFENFVQKVLSKKVQDIKKAQTNGLNKSLGGGGGAIVKSPKGGLVDFINPPISEETQDNLEGIMNGIDSILDTLRNEEKLDKKESKEDKKELEKQKRSKRESLLESKAFKGIQKTVSKVLAPVKGMFDKVLDFLSVVAVGNVALSIFEWFADKDNQKKIDTIFRFIKDWWPALLGGLILFGGALLGPVGLIAGVTILAIGFIPKLVDATKQLLGFGEQTEKDAKKVEDDLKSAGDSVKVDDILPEELKGADKKLEETKNLKEPVQMKKGGSVPGSGPNKDTVPAMLSPGEFVMSRGAVQKYGTSTLHSMNTMGGGSGIPSFSNGIMYASSGGDVGTEPGGRNKNNTSSENSGRAWWDFLGWAGTGNKPTSNVSTPSSKSTGGGSIKGLSAQDFADLAFIVSAEAQRNTNDEYGVAAAVLNRVADPAWPNTIKAVGSQAGQFEAVYKGLAKDDPELAAKLGSVEGQAKIVKALKMLKGRTDFKGTSQYGNMGSGDIKFSSRGNFYHYKEQIGKYDPPPTPLPSYYAKFIGAGGPSVALANTSPSSGGTTSSRSSSTSRTTTQTAAKFKSNTKPVSIPPPTFESAAADIASIRELINADFSGNSQPTPAESSIPDFAADVMNSMNKIKTLGVL